ncbi:ly6/PLAUR domain-containing protein 2-like [Coregonus clupeaformis]|uniref:ly6/PLAUR domain-containing protein 2-like n=1 Tax=Coregonus clupeaformis TaxID=59861 RepID=UPI001BE0E247|nr:ly6/PLAUR domain-containing protein 2-like [Coregonus clupeaformis]
MKTILVFLMPILFGNVAVEALQCYACLNVNSSAQCNQNTVTCTFSGDTCMTIVSQMLGVQSISKTCTTSSACAAATSTNLNLGGLGGNQVTCCQTDLCNVNGSSVSGLNFLLLSLSFLISGLVLSL